ncbi:Cytochrome P450 89A9 [Glycine soja]|uniref:Cytochrome P450 89A9 isoform A n=1 Tax=Glycine soja TaxID=3848 RepID=A0A445K056_GLYSO|nr:cytochrome P450 89A2-like [Glycine soja]RZC04091.1 Cytochrome P450 89A9 isoform A [Glycine soja]
MEAWFIIPVTLCVCMLTRAILFSLHKKTITIPPGPPHIPIISSILWLRKTFSELEAVVKTLHAKYGPIITLRIGTERTIFIADHSLAHQALIQHGSLFSDRPKARAALKILSSNQHNISSASYGVTWRTLRRNLASEMLHPSSVKSFSRTRKWVVHTLLTRLKSDSSQSNNPIKVIHHFQYAMFYLLVFMCFGERLDNGKVRDIERVLRQMLLRFGRFNILNFWPKVTMILLHKRWEELFRCRKEQEDVMVPIIRARKQKRAKEGVGLNDGVVVSYVDTLLDLQLPEEKRELSEEEMVTLCNEFMNAGTDTTSTALQWIMANLVKYPHMQEKVVEEIREIVGEREEREVKEEDLHKLSYLKAVILEGLRRHPPAHIVSHAVTEDVVFNDYLVPKNGTVNFMVAMIGLDPKVWEDPMAFKPERFLNDEEFDITGNKEIKMMPFGAGRRICPAYNLALLHLEYFVANLVWNFKWRVPEGGDVDLSEILEFSGVMKNALQIHISPRI